MSETAPTQLQTEEPDEASIRARIEELRREADIVGGNIEEIGESGDDEPMGSQKYLDALRTEIRALESQIATPGIAEDEYDDNVE